MYIVYCVCDRSQSWGQCVGNVIKQGFSPQYIHVHSDLLQCNGNVMLLMFKRNLYYAFYKTTKCALDVTIVIGLYTKVSYRYCTLNLTLVDVC